MDAKSDLDGLKEAPTLSIGAHQVKMRGLLFKDEEVEEPSLSPLMIDPVSVRPEATPLNVAWKDDIRLRTVMDSGAAESVGPPSMAPRVQIQ